MKKQLLWEDGYWPTIAELATVLNGFKKAPAIKWAVTHGKLNARKGSLEVDPRKGEVLKQVKAAAAEKGAWHINPQDATVQGWFNQIEHEQQQFDAKYEQELREGLERNEAQTNKQLVQEQAEEITALHNENEQLKIKVISLTSELEQLKTKFEYEVMRADYQEQRANDLKRMHNELLAAFFPQDSSHENLEESSEGAVQQTKPRVRDTLSSPRIHRNGK